MEVADEEQVLERAEAEGLALGRLGDHWHTPDEAHPQGLVVGYGTPRERVYPEALEVLGKVLESTDPVR